MTPPAADLDATIDSIEQFATTNGEWFCRLCFAAPKPDSRMRLQLVIRIRTGNRLSSNSGSPNANDRRVGTRA